MRYTIHFLLLHTIVESTSDDEESGLIDFFLNSESFSAPQYVI